MSKEIMENDMCMEACEGVTEPMVWIPVSRFEELIWSETRFCTLQGMIEAGVELPKICRVFGLDHKKTTGDRLAELPDPEKEFSDWENGARIIECDEDKPNEAYDFEHNYEELEHE